MTNMSINPLWLTHFIEILLVLEFQLTKIIVGAFSYKAHFRPQISSNDINPQEQHSHNSTHYTSFRKKHRFHVDLSDLPATF